LGGFGRIWRAAGLTSQTANYIFFYIFWGIIFYFHVYAGTGEQNFFVIDGFSFSFSCFYWFEMMICCLFPLSFALALDMGDGIGGGGGENWIFFWPAMQVLYRAVSDCGGQPGTYLKKGLNSRRKPINAL
jgi:hypothetical protein